MQTIDERRLNDFKLQLNFAKEEIELVKKELFDVKQKMKIIERESIEIKQELCELKEQIERCQYKELSVSVQKNNQELLSEEHLKFNQLNEYERRMSLANINHFYHPKPFRENLMHKSLYLNKIIENDNNDYFREGYIQFTVPVFDIQMVDDILDSCKDELNGEKYKIYGLNMDGTIDNIFFPTTILKIDVNKMNEKLNSLEIYDTTEENKLRITEYFKTSEFNN